MQDEVKTGEGAWVGRARPGPLGGNTAEKGKRETLLMTAVSWFAEAPNLLTAPLR